MASTKTTAPALAESVNDLVNYIQTVICLLHEQVDTMAMATEKPARIQASSNICVLLHCADRYLGDMKALCNEAKEGGAR